MGYMDILKYMVASDYWEGLSVVAIVMLAEIIKGIYFNLSFWYKLTDETYWGSLLLSYRVCRDFRPEHLAGTHLWLCSFGLGICSRIRSDYAVILFHRTEKNTR